MVVLQLSFKIQGFIFFFSIIFLQDNEHKHAQEYGQ